jgi:hypothetical protein
MKREEAELLAIEGLQYLAANEAELERFLALSGVALSDLRDLAGSPAFLSGVLDYFLGEEASLLAFAASAGRRPDDVPLARAVLSRVAPEGD